MKPKEKLGTNTKLNPFGLAPLSALFSYSSTPSCLFCLKLSLASFLLRGMFLSRLFIAKGCMSLMGASRQ